MISNTAQSARKARPQVGIRLAGVALGLLAALGSVHAAPQATSAPVAPAASLDPAKQLPGAVSVADIDFKRGDDGAGRLVVHFTGDGATPDLRKVGSSVVVDIGNARLPDNLRKTLDVSDFATPVTRVDPRIAMSAE